MGLVHVLMFYNEGCVHLLFLRHIMKLHKASLISISSAIALVVYVFSVTPSLSNPLSLAGFYIIGAVLIMSSLYRLLAFLKSRTKRYLWALSGTLFIVYIGALGTLNALSITNVSLATTVLLALLFMIDRS